MEDFKNASRFMSLNGQRLSYIQLIQESFQLIISFIW